MFTRFGFNENEDLGWEYECSLEIKCGSLMSV